MKAAIIGSTGYGGAELNRILTHHPEISGYSNHSSSQAGELLTSSYPHLLSAAEQPLQEIDAEKIAKEADVVFTATPTGISSELIPELMDAGLKVIDLAGDHRLKDTAQYEKWYKKAPGNVKWINEAVYGLTEWLETDLQEADLIANPGCFPTAALLGLAPLVKVGNIDEKSIIIDAKTGVSGAGRTPGAASHFSEMNDNLKIYKVNAHQHIPEIEQMLNSWNKAIAPITFNTHLVPMTRGIMTTIYANVREGISEQELFDLYQTAYQDSYFVRIREKGVFPSTKEVYGSNFCDISLAYDERTNRITIVSVIDNLMKGAAGQAVQNMNKMFGMDEKTGLEFIPVYP
jgi:N-acetyl-gamma-glutamyl-phosphate reductase